MFDAFIEFFFIKVLFYLAIPIRIPESFTYTKIKVILYEHFRKDQLSIYEKPLKKISRFLFE